MSTASEFYLGQVHTCVLWNTSPKKVSCFGSNGKGELGIGATDDRGDGPDELGSNLPFIDFGTGVTISSLYVGGRHNCIATDSDQIKCWGLNDDGQLGLGDTVSRGISSSQMGDSLPFSNLGSTVVMQQLALGNLHSCSLFTNGKVKCWGQSTYGQLGYGTTLFGSVGDAPSDMGDSLPFVDLGVGISGVSIASGPTAYHTCVIFDTAGLKCWGYNAYGQLGLGNTYNIGDGENEMGLFLQFVQFGSSRTIKKISLGDGHTCIIMDNDRIKCWGLNSDGQLGLGDTDNRCDQSNETGDNLAEVDVGSSATALQITTGYRHTCALMSPNVLKCWGNNANGQLGLGDTTTRGTTSATTGDNLGQIVFGPEYFVSKIYAGSAHNCAFVQPGKIKCWGGNGFGQLGLGDMNSRGDESNEMGSNLPFTIPFPTVSPTKSPSTAPTLPSPTVSPSKAPSQSPIASPTKNPTENPTSTPTQPPTKAPSATPSATPTNNPTTLAPTGSPTKKTSSPSLAPTQTTPTTAYTNSVDCYMITDKKECEAATKSSCGGCAYFTTTTRFGFRALVNFVMDGNRRFNEFEDSVTPKKTLFKDALKLLIIKYTDGTENIAIDRYGQINQVLGQNFGNVYYNIQFLDNNLARDKAKNFILNANFSNYVPELNTVLNKKLRTTGKTYITGSVTIDRYIVATIPDETGACGCIKDELTSHAPKSSIISNSFQLIVIMITTSFIMANRLYT